MPWIKVIPEEKAEGKLKECYQQIAFPGTGKVSRVIQLMSLHPELMMAVRHLGRIAQQGTENVTAIEKQMVAVVVSSLNKCRY